MVNRDELVEYHLENGSSDSTVIAMIDRICLLEDTLNKIANAQQDLFDVSKIRKLIKSETL